MSNSVVNARLSIQRALLGKVVPALRAVVFSLEGVNVEVRFYFDGFISEVDKESASVVETEILADYEESVRVEVRCIRLDSPEPINDGGVWVYQRREVD